MPSLIAVTRIIKASGRAATDPAAAPNMGNTGDAIREVVRGGL
jgi:hypothetical protein